MLMRDVVMVLRLNLLVELDRHVKAHVQAQNEIDREQELQNGIQTAGHEEESDGEVPEGAYLSPYSSPIFLSASLLTPDISCLSFSLVIR